MKTSIVLMLKPALFLILGMIAVSAFSDTVTGRVIRIDDGDTITLVDDNQHQMTVRLAWIDAPHQLQAFGPRAQANLGNLLSGQDVQVVLLQQGRDGNLRGKVIVSPPDSGCRGRPECPKTLDAGLQQVADGMAWWHAQSVQEQAAKDRAAYQHTEFDAKIHRRGLWADTNPIPPWKWPH